MLYFLITIFLSLFTPFEKAPDFQFVHESGDIQSLSSYDGSVVYVAFWASWCQPCLSNFKEYNKLREELKEKGVVLLNVSLDKNNKDWEKALMSYSFLNGENVRVTDLQEVMGLYGLRHIPAYRILNNEREIQNLGQKLDKDMVQIFDKLLKE